MSQVSEKQKQEPSAKIVHCLYVKLAQNQCVIHVLGRTQTFELESILFCVVLFKIVFGSIDLFGSFTYMLLSIFW